MHVTLAGTGTSHGIPVIGCSCSCCTSTDFRDTRLRSSAFITADNGASIIIDTGPDFRQQALVHKLSRLDAVFLTHSHADHLHGLDDVRIFSNTCHRHPSLFHQSPELALASDCTLPLYAGPHTIHDVEQRFSYIFKHTQEGGGKPRLLLRNVFEYSADNPLVIENISIIPVPMKHGSIDSVGYHITNTRTSKTAAYMTDCSEIPLESRRIIQNADHLIIDGLRKRPHSTHFSFDEAASLAYETGAHHAWLTHICHDCTHVQIDDYLKEFAAQYEKTHAGQPSADHCAALTNSEQTGISVSADQTDPHCSPPPGPDRHKKSRTEIHPAYDGLVLTL